MEDKSELSYYLIEFTIGISGPYRGVVLAESENHAQEIILADEECEKVENFKVVEILDFVLLKRGKIMINLE